MAYGVSKFQRGSAVFTCECCTRRTRATNSDHAQNGLCDACYELAGIENAFSDYGRDEAFGEYGVQARELLAKVEAKNGSLEHWQELIAELVAYENPVAPVAEPVAVVEPTVALITFGGLAIGGSFKVAGGDGLWVKVSKSSAKLLSRRLNPVSGTRTKFAADLPILFA